MVEFFAFFPASLCGVLVFCCALPFVSRLSPSVAFALLYSHTTLSDTHATSSHTTLSHTTYSQQLTRTQLSYTHTRTHTHTTLSHTTLSHATLTHNFLTHNSLTHTQLTHTQLSHIQRAWRAWHLATSTFASCGRRGAYGTGLALVARLGSVGAVVGAVVYV